MKLNKFAAMRYKLDYMFAKSIKPDLAETHTIVLYIFKHSDLLGFCYLTERDSSEGFIQSPRSRWRSSTQSSKMAGVRRRLQGFFKKHFPIFEKPPLFEEPSLVEEPPSSKKARFSKTSLSSFVDTEDRRTSLHLRSSRPKI